MIEFQLSRLSCEGCAARVTRAVKAVDEHAAVRVDLSTKTVRIESSLPPDRIARALTESGFSPV